MLSVQRDHDGGVFAPLAFVNRKGISECKLIKLAKIVNHVTLFVTNDQLLVDLINGADEADVAVEHPTLVVVDNLDDLVAGGKGPAETANLRARRRRAKHLLQAAVQMTRPQLRSVHRC